MFEIYVKLQIGFNRWQYHYDSTTLKYTYLIHTNAHMTQNDTTKKQANQPTYLHDSEDILQKMKTA
jgi:hypothetical protein